MWSNYNSHKTKPMAADSEECLFLDQGLIAILFYFNNYFSTRGVYLYFRGAG